MTHDTSRNPGPNDHLMRAWTDLWNGELDLAGQICAPELAIRFGGKRIAPAGDAVRTPDDLAALIRDFRAPLPGLRYSVVEAHTTDEFGHCVWDATMEGLSVGGIDTFRFADGRITTVHSVTGERPMGE